MSLPKALSSPMTVYPVRFGPQTDLKSSLINFVDQNNLKSAFVLTCVGSVSKATLRFAEKGDGSQLDIVTFNEHFEICSLVGTVCAKSAHLHIVLGRSDGTTLSGHVVGDLEIFTTAEIVLGNCDQIEFDRKFDAETGYDELSVKKSE